MQSASRHAAAPPLLLLALLALAMPTRGEWLTGRGDFQRTGNPEGKAGPAVPRVLWVYKAKEHFVASPTPGDVGLFVSALGAYNTGLFRCLSMRTDAPERVLWSKSSPFIKRPTVCSPAAASDVVIFGDGMHQTDDAWLYALKVDTGRLVWQLPVPGKLVHLEAPPTVAGASVFVCGGAAGVLCVALDRVTLENQEMSPAQAQERVDKAWEEIKAKYEVERAKHPDFALPPDEDSLPKPAPKIRWQKGKDIWHIDAPVALSGNRLFAASSYLEEEQTGKRALLCLRTENGEQIWELPLQINPWAGPTVAGNLVLVAGSTIRFDPELIAKAAGDVVAVDLSTGQLKWRQVVPGGVLSPVAVSNDTAFFTSTDGKLRALDTGTGKEAWSYDAGRPFFAGPAVAGRTVYVVDLKGALHAVDTTDGKRLWRMDVSSAPEVFAPGMVYGSPVVVDGRIYIATCNVHDGGSDSPGAIVCIADESVKAREAAAVRIDVDTKKRTVSIPCRIAPRKLPFLAEIYPLEVAASLPAPEGQKAHETVVTFEARPEEIRKALLKIGLREGKPVRGDTTEPPSGDLVRIYIELKMSADSSQTVPIESTVVDMRTGRPLPALTWYFTGSSMRQPDPEKDLKVLGADSSGTLMTLFPVTDETLIQSSLQMADRRLLRLETNKELLPPEGSDARILICAVTPDGGAASPAGRTATQSWRPPPPDTLSPYVGSSQIQIMFDDWNGTNEPSRIEGFTSQRTIPLPPQPVWSPRKVPDGVLFLGSPSITAPEPPPMAVGPHTHASRDDIPLAVALPAPAPPAVLPSSATSGRASAETDSAVFRTVPLQRQSAAPRIHMTIPDPFETKKALRMNVQTPDTDSAMPPPLAPAVTNMPDRVAVTGQKKN